MVKSTADRVFIVNNIIGPNGTKKSAPEPPSDGPPQIPPRMKKKGPALPEKPPHIRAKSNPTPSSQPSIREPLKPRILPSSNIEKYLGPQREVLVAASKAIRERPVEKRQREPAKLLMPTSGGPPTKSDLLILPSKTSPILEDRLSSPARKPEQSGKGLGIRKSTSSRPPQPILLIPRGMLPWGSAPVSYALWMQRDAAPGKGSPRREPVRQPPKPDTSTRARSGSVTRSGSLTSQGSTSSESGNETFPKSVLKKQKRNGNNTTSKGSSGNPCRKIEPKKNVTFNAFATVQLMEE